MKRLTAIRDAAGQLRRAYLRAMGEPGRLAADTGPALCCCGPCEPLFARPCWYSPDPTDLPGGCDRNQRPTRRFACGVRFDDGRTLREVWEEGRATDRHLVLHHAGRCYNVGDAAFFDTLEDWPASVPIPTGYIVRHDEPRWPGDNENLPPKAMRYPCFALRCRSGFEFVRAIECTNMDRPECGQAAEVWVCRTAIVGESMTFRAGNGGRCYCVRRDGPGRDFSLLPAGVTVYSVVPDQLVYESCDQCFQSTPYPCTSLPRDCENYNICGPPFDPCNCCESQCVTRGYSEFEYYSIGIDGTITHYVVREDILIRPDSATLTVTYTAIANFTLPEPNPATYPIPNGGGGSCPACRHVEPNTPPDANCPGVRIGLGFVQSILSTAPPAIIMGAGRPTLGQPCSIAPAYGTASVSATCYRYVAQWNAISPLNPEFPSDYRRSRGYVSVNCNRGTPNPSRRSDCPTGNSSTPLGSVAAETVAPLSILDYVP